MKTTLLLLFLTLLFSSTFSQFTESGLPVEEHVVPIEEEVVAPPTEEAIAVPTEEEIVVPTEEQPLSDWVPLNLSQVSTSPQVQGLLYIGIQNATQQAIQAGYLPNGTYQITQVNNIEQNQAVTNVQEYRFDVDVSDSQGDTGTILFEITYDPVQRTSTVTSYSVTGQGNTNEESFLSEEEILPGYAPLDPEQALTDPQIQGLLQIGMQNATDQAIQAGSLLNGTYYVAQINSIEQNLDAVNVMEYRFDVNISSVNATNISDLVFEITYNPSTGASQVTSYSIKNIPTSETYTPLDLTAISDNPKIQGLIDVGAQNVTQQAIQNGSLPNGTYQVDKVNSAGQGVLNNNDYQFNVSVNDNNGTTADALFNLTNKNISEPPIIMGYLISNVVTENTTTTVTNTTNTTSVTTNNGLPKGYTAIDVNSPEASEAYQIGEDGFNQIISDATLNGKLPFSYYTLSSVNGAGKKVEKNREYYWFDIDVADGLGNSAELVFTMSYNPRTGNAKVVNYSVENVKRAF